MASGLSQRPGMAVKRVIDLVFALLLMIATAPFLLLGALWVLVDDGSPVLFRQKRVGRDMRPFTITKLRTLKMHDIDPTYLGQVDDSTPLLTTSGRFLRRLRIDELPQLMNVLSGDMSLVGPRPTLPEHAVSYDEYQARRLAMRPGLTGWAQVSGNTQLSWEDRILLDVWYVDRWSLALDWRILVETVRVVFEGEQVDEARLKEARDHANGSSRRS